MLFRLWSGLHRLHRVAGGDAALTYDRNGMQLWPTYLCGGDVGAINKALQLHHGRGGAAAGRGAGRRAGRQAGSSGDIKMKGPFVQAPWSCGGAAAEWCAGEVTACQQVIRQASGRVGRASQHGWSAGSMHRASAPAHRSIRHSLSTWCTRCSCPFLQRETRQLLIRQQRGTAAGTAVFKAARAAAAAAAAAA